ncbi:MAG TPA: lipid IV(A) 3-deoxy-D-manno-octulosonic acid transferase [Steroidobacteraceae bacterium]
MRFIYVLLTYLLVPLVMAFEAWQALTRPEYRGRLGQRLGFVPRLPRPGCVWVHAVSVGEVQAAAGLVHELRRRHPDLALVVSTVTPTGAQRARALFKDTVQHCYLPYDLPGAVRRFLDRIAPRAAIMLETEIWPTLYAELGRRGVPLVIGSARLSAKSVGRYRRLASLLHDTLAQGIFVGAQTPADAERFRLIGAPPARVQVTGNVKFDLEIPQAQVEAGRALRLAWGAARPVWIAGSTHEGEEEAALVAHAAVRARHPDALLLLVPRHPQRFDAVGQLLDRRGVRHARRSKGLLPRADDEVYLVDTLGELQMLYAASDVAFVGGSLVPIGGHNLLEPAVLGLPIVSGPHTQNGPDIAELLSQSGALRLVDDAPALGAALLHWFDDPALAKSDGECGRRAVEGNRGALGRLVAMIEPLLG